MKYGVMLCELDCQFDSNPIRGEEFEFTANSNAGVLKTETSDNFINYLIK